MTLIYPATADAFRCIADACRHTCCKGWEIDIDPNTRAKYAAMTGEIGQRLRDAIADTPDGASFRLREDERCPMLNDSGLCDIITACGEGALCQICADHPRYRNEFSTFTEVGFGLCCEAAADLTLHWPADDVAYAGRRHTSAGVAGGRSAAAGAGGAHPHHAGQNTRHSGPAECLV